jgi:pyruvate,orthophosphate dikinase
VAYRLNKTCIVGCGGMAVDENRRRCSFKTAVLETGDWIGIDGLGGSIYKGRIAGGTQVQERGVFPT